MIYIKYVAQGIYRLISDQSVIKLLFYYISENIVSPAKLTFRYLINT